MVTKTKRAPVSKAGKGQQSAPAAASPNGALNAVTMPKDCGDGIRKHAGMLNHSMNLLTNVVRWKGEDKPSKDGMDFAFEAVVGFDPKDPGELMLVQQMAACHDLLLSLLTRAKQAEYLSQQEQHGNLSVKLMNVYLAQFQALTKARKPQQIVEVQHTHRHLHVNGQVAPGEGVVAHIEGQAHEGIDPAALALAPGPALLSQDPPRNGMSVAPDQARAMQDPRRRVRHGGT